jgi:HAD superfamily hydrolase (TIGR01509 family)
MPPDPEAIGRMIYSTTMPIQALIFDFDGLILDTETPLVDVWKAIYAEHGFEYPKEHWSITIGGWGNGHFDPAAALHNLSSGKLDYETLHKRGDDESNAIIDASPVMQGAREILVAGRQRGLRLAIASSSERAWVEPHLARLGLLDYFEKVVCGDDVAPGRTKPHPDVFLKALSVLQLKPQEALVLEDSPNGITAARQAGLAVVAIPNPVTRLLPMEGADLTLDSLDAMPLDEILERVAMARGGAQPQTPAARSG